MLDKRLLKGAPRPVWLVTYQQPGRVAVETVRAATEYAAIGSLFLAGKWRLGDYALSITDVWE